MKLHADPRSKKNIVTGHGPGWVAINEQRYQHSLLLTAERIDAEWGPAPGEAIEAGHLTALTAHAGAVVLLGTGNRQRFPAPQLLRPLIEAGIGVEVMDTPAACRTYNILVAEDRDTVAALVVE